MYVCFVVFFAVFVQQLRNYSGFLFLFFAVVSDIN